MKYKFICVIVLLMIAQVGLPFSGTYNLTDIPAISTENEVFNIEYMDSYSGIKEIVFSLPAYVSLSWEKHPETYMVYGLLLLLSLTIYVVYNAFQGRKEKQLIEEINKQIERDIFQSKLGFYTGVMRNLSVPADLINRKCEKLLEMHEIDQATKQCMDEVRLIAARINGLTGQLMEFGKAEFGNLPIKVEKIDVIDLVAAVLDDFQYIIEKNKIEKNININPEIGFFQTDLDSLSKIVYNLISNAIKNTPAFGCIDIEVQISMNKCSFEVTNSGQGIKQEDSNILNRFGMLDNNNESVTKFILDKNEIGLSLCSLLVYLLKGKINVKNKNKESSTIKVTLPSLPIDDDWSETLQPVIYRKNKYFDTAIKADLESTRKPADFFDADKNKRRLDVLVIGKNENEILNLMQDSTEGRYELSFVSDEPEALNRINSQAPDLIISNILMSGMDGSELTYKVKNSKNGNSIPILLSSNAMNKERIDELCSKPADMKHFTRNSKLRSAADSIRPTSSCNEEIMNRCEEFTENTIEPYTNLSSLNRYFIRSLLISKIQLCRKLDAATAKFVQNMRFNRHCKLLATTTSPMRTILFRCGFNNKAPPHF